MFKKNKLTLAVAFSISALSWGIASADQAEYPAGTALADTNTVSETSPTFVFDYDPAMSGVIVDLTEGLDTAGDSVTTALTTDATQCAPVSETVFLSLSDMNCSAAGCEWIPSTPLKDKAAYYLNYEKLIDGVADLTARSDCNGGAGGAGGGVAFAVDTVGGGTVVPPTAPPEQVVITTNPGDSCTDGVGNADCVIEFKHSNDPAASHYRVWIADKNGIQIDEDALSAKANQDVDINGWFEVDTVGGGAPLAGKARVSCTPQLDGSRECKLEIEGTDIGGVHPVIVDLKGGKKFKVWVRAWNAKGYADWSDSVEIDID